MDDDGTPPPPPPEEQSLPPPPPHTHTGSPTDFLKGVVGKRVIVRLTSGVDYRGAYPLSLVCARTNGCIFFSSQECFRA